MKPRFSKAFVFILTVVLFLGITAIVTGWAVKKASVTTDSSYIPKAAPITEETKLLQALVRIDTSNPPGDVTAAAKLIAEHLRKQGIAAELIESAPGRWNVYARIRGAKRGDGLLLLQHLDVVPAQPKGWSAPPFSAEIRRHVMYGRGVLDMKGIGVCHLAAFVDIAHSGQVPERDLVFLATADEERGGRLGLEWILEHRPDVVEGVAHALSEGGLTEVVGDRLTRYSIEVGTRQFVELTAHSPRRESLRELRMKLEPRFDPRDADRVLPEVREYFRSIGPSRKRNPELLSDIDATVAAGKEWLLEPPYRNLLYDGVYMSGARAAGKEFVADIILSNLPDTNPDAAIARLREVLPPDVTLEVGLKMGPASITSTSDPIYEAIREVAGAHFGVTDIGPVILPFSTSDCRHLRTRGVACLGVPTFMIDFFQSEGIHGVDERLRLDWFGEGVVFTKKLVRRLVLAPKR